MRNSVLSLSFIVSLIIAGCSADSGIEVTGNYEYSSDVASRGKALCFVPSPESAAALPRQAAPRFCFSNEDESKQLLGAQTPPNAVCRLSGEATVLIDEYQANVSQGNGIDTAKLLSVQKISSVRKQACE